MLPFFLLLSLSIYCWAQCYGIEYPFGQQCCLCSLPTLSYPQPQLLGWQSRERKDLDVLQALFNRSENIRVLSIPFNHKSKTQQVWCSHLLWRKSTPSQSDLVHVWVILQLQLFSFCIWKEYRQVSSVSGPDQNDFYRSRKIEYVPSTVTVSELSTRKLLSVIICTNN